MKKAILAMALLASVSLANAKIIEKDQVLADYTRLKTEVMPKRLEGKTPQEKEKTTKDFEKMHPAYAVASYYMDTYERSPESPNKDLLDTALHILRTGYFWGISSTRKANSFEVQMAQGILLASLQIEGVRDSLLKALTGEAGVTAAERAHKAVIRDFFQFGQDAGRKMAEMAPAHKPASAAASSRIYSDEDTVTVYLETFLDKLYPEIHREERIYARLYKIFNPDDSPRRPTENEWIIDILRSTPEARRAWFEFKGVQEPLTNLGAIPGEETLSEMAQAATPSEPLDSTRDARVAASNAPAAFAAATSATISPERDVRRARDKAEREARIARDKAEKEAIKIRLEPLLPRIKALKTAYTSPGSTLNKEKSAISTRYSNLRQAEYKRQNHAKAEVWRLVAGSPKGLYKIMTKPPRVLTEREMDSLRSDWNRLVRSLQNGDETLSLTDEQITKILRLSFKSDSPTRNDPIATALDNGIPLNQTDANTLLFLNEFNDYILSVGMDRYGKPSLAPSAILRGEHPEG